MDYNKIEKIAYRKTNQNTFTEDTYLVDVFYDLRVYYLSFMSFKLSESEISHIVLNIIIPKAIDFTINNYIL